MSPESRGGTWDLAASTTLPDGALGLHYQRRWPVGLRMDIEAHRVAHGI